MQKAAEGIVEYADLTIIGPTGCAAFAPSDARVHEVPDKLAPFLLQGSIAAWLACRQQRFDLLLGGSGLTAPILQLLKAIFTIPSAVFIHGLDIVVDNAVYQKFFVPALRGVDLVISNSLNTQHLALAKGVPADRITVINPGTVLPDRDSILSRESFCSKFDINYSHLLLFTGRITRRKGLSRFIAESLPSILDALPNTGLLVVGDNPNRSLNQKGEEQEVLALVAQSGLENHIRFLGQVSDEDLLAAYSAADVQIFPLIEVQGDVEGFGMVAVEAAAAGTPTIAFSLGGIPDAINPNENCGKLIPAARYDLFTASVLEALRHPKENQLACITHAEKYSWARFHLELEAQLSKQIAKDDSSTPHS